MREALRSIDANRAKWRSMHGVPMMDALSPSQSPAERQLMRSIWGLSGNEAMLRNTKV